MNIHCIFMETLCMKLTVNKWGHSLGIRIPSHIAKKSNMKDGSTVEIIEHKEGILLKPVEEKLSLEDILLSIPDDYNDDSLFDEITSTEEW